MKLFTEEQFEKLKENGSPENRDKDHAPVAQLTMPFTNAIWLLSEIDPEEPNIAFGLCDFGMGFPELGYVDLNELTSVKHPLFGTAVINNLIFEGKYPMSVYSTAARAQEQIVCDDEILKRFAPKNQNPKPNN